MDMTTTSNTTKAVFMKCTSTKDSHAIMLLLPWYFRIYNVLKIQTGNVEIPFLKIYLRQSLRTSCEPACNTHFSNNAFCITLMCTSSLFLLELPQFGMPYPQLLYMLWFMQFCSPWYKLSLYLYNWFLNWYKIIGWK